ncbi:hypothetical protein SODALDRAFT_170665 [Sodiomyces alkalinus F11]|uniref:Uncharacterized protein n=1 Tax=Sodiomyces alkalinus (strain CBS 110278 / VKM F-3762 / F11) TaxID=1314773 RepID=A0A3N2PWR8_SODAK|nr:hypothetical protein SODALDRAFT_170665 [Sodiomyces alkalinus F11]ROT38775.1 hypothetical protein SODALDRAFT_170665 [Sodiomyces alkalinus F11]
MRLCYWDADNLQRWYSGFITFSSPRWEKGGVDRCGLVFFVGFFSFVFTSPGSSGWWTVSWTIQCCTTLMVARRWAHLAFDFCFSVSLGGGISRDDTGERGWSYRLTIFRCSSRGSLHPILPLTTFIVFLVFGFVSSSGVQHPEVMYESGRRKTTLSGPDFSGFAGLISLIFAGTHMFFFLPSIQSIWSVVVLGSVA